MGKSVQELFEEQINNNKQSVYEKNEAAGGNVEQRKLYLDAADEHGDMKKGGMTLKKKNKGSCVADGIHMKKKKKKKYFIGGLIGLHMLTKEGGPLAALRKKRDEKRKNSEGKIMTVRVVGEGGGNGAGEKNNEKELEETETAEQENVDAAGQTNAKSGAVVKKRRYIKADEGAVNKPSQPPKQETPKPNTGANDKNPVNYVETRPTPPPAPTVAQETVEKTKKNVAKKGIEKTVAKGTTTAVSKGAPKLVGRIGSKFIPGLGWVSLGADGTYLAMKAKSQAYKEMEERSPGVPKHLETGAYGMQTSDSGHKVRGTFFGSMK